MKTYVFTEEQLLAFLTEHFHYNPEAEPREVLFGLLDMLARERRVQILVPMESCEVIE